MVFDPSDIPPESFQAKIEELEAKRRPIAERLEKIDTELAWWRQGQRLFGEGTADSAANGAKPPLRQAILRVMRQQDRAEWNAKAVFQALSEHGWQPTGQYGLHTVRQRLRDMAVQGEIEKPERGTFALKEVST